MAVITYKVSHNFFVNNESLIWIILNLNLGLIFRPNLPTENIVLFSILLNYNSWYPFYLTQKKYTVCFRIWTSLPWLFFIKFWFQTWANFRSCTQCLKNLWLLQKQSKIIISFIYLNRWLAPHCRFPYASFKLKNIKYIRGSYTMDGDPNLKK